MLSSARGNSHVHLQDFCTYATELLEADALLLSGRLHTRSIAAEGQGPASSDAVWSSQREGWPGLAAGGVKRGVKPQAKETSGRKGEQGLFDSGGAFLRGTNQPNDERATAEK
ncbi:hypothetical protein Dda_5510 [Drechslerella dactyloides]|uniref:Uncharacterized protein n=1 Tax=Drechslerella dactyloides TaxID=74499 RepID=A0AAD6IWN3_DREDA|nr:hypothetical protein Dda_5510 [Drechslerella dactyloides]